MAIQSLNSVNNYSAALKNVSFGDGEAVKADAPKAEVKQDTVTLTKDELNNTIKDAIKEERDEHKGGIGPAIASFIIPGLGQGINKEGGKGWLHFGGAVAVKLAILATRNTVLQLANLGLHIYSAIDAYNGDINKNNDD